MLEVRKPGFRYFKSLVQGQYRQGDKKKRKVRDILGIIFTNIGKITRGRRKRRGGRGNSCFYMLGTDLKDLILTITC